MYLTMKKTGFTLIELIVTVAIIAILLSAGLPGMQTLLGTMTINSTTNQLAASLNYARGQAISRVVGVSVCRSTTGTSCGTNWNDGWIIFIDADLDGSYDPSPGGDEIVRVENITQSGSTLTLVGNGGVDVISFDNLGENTSTDSATFTITLGTLDPRTVRVSTVGTVSTD